MMVVLLNKHEIWLTRIWKTFQEGTKKYHIISQKALKMMQRAKSYARKI